MRYDVLWVPAAEQGLAAIWMDSHRRDAVTQSAREIDELLRDDPEDVGESRADGRRILLVPPLGVLFRVFPQDPHVYVLTVWHYKSHE